MAKYKIRIQKEYSVVVPATELLSTPLFGGSSTKIADVPERRFDYPNGQIFYFRNKKDMTQWIKNCPVPFEILEF